MNRVITEIFIYEWFYFSVSINLLDKVRPRIETQNTMTAVYCKLHSVLVPPITVPMVQVHAPASPSTRCIAQRVHL